MLDSQTEKFGNTLSSISCPQHFFCERFSFAIFDIFSSMHAAISHIVCKAVAFD